MPYISGFNRQQLMCCSWDTLVEDESIARIIDRFVNYLDLKKYGVKEPASEGRPAYNLKSLYKLYIYGSREEMIEKAKEGYFLRDPERELVYCPAGEILRQKSIRKSGSICYANKNACKHCKNRSKCYKGKILFKEILAKISCKNPAKIG